MSAAAKLLEHLQCVKQTASDRWLACCPSHPDRSPSLSIRKLDDGRVLVHDFGGCAVVSAAAKWKCMRQLILRLQAVRTCIPASRCGGPEYITINQSTGDVGAAARVVEPGLSRP